VNPMIFALPGNELLAEALVEAMRAQRGTIAMRHFPDEETYLRVEQPVNGRDVLIAATLDRPNSKLVDLYLLASTLREGGARRIVLVAPYLPYMRQDRSFSAGEGVSAAHIARWLSSFLDGLVTVEPHLHRIRALEQVYRMPVRTVHVPEAIGRWVRENVTQPLLIGPDEESGSWVAGAAAIAACKYLVLKKLRHGDRDVSIVVPGVQQFPEHTPVLLDDIISSGATLVEAAHKLKAVGAPPPVCVAVHAIFAQEAYERLQHAGVDRIVTCNTILHPSNAIDVHREIALAAADLLASVDRGVAA